MLQRQRQPVAVGLGQGLEAEFERPGLQRLAAGEREERRGVDRRTDRITVGLSASHSLLFDEQGQRIR